MSRRRLFSILSGVSTASFLLLYFVHGGYRVQYLHAQSTNTPVVTLDDIAQAGFTNARVQPPQGQAFQPPELYFRVNETVAKTHPEWGDAANLLNVFVRNMHSVAGWTYKGDEMKTQDFAGRTSISVFTPDYYIVVIGPDAQKAQSLLTLLKNKFQ